MINHPPTAPVDLDQPSPRPTGYTRLAPGGRADSVQWVVLPGRPRLDLAALERLYFSWVPAVSAGFVGPRYEPGPRGRVLLGLRPRGWPLLIGLAPPEEAPGRRARPILGGLLARPGGALSFEADPEGEDTRLTVAVRGLHYRLPPFLYLRVQAQLHERSTYAFLRQVARGAARAHPGRASNNPFPGKD